MSKVFISYGSVDRKVAESLCSYLESKAVPCWIAPRDITTGNYAGEITRALRAADIFIVICSNESCKSEHVKNEVTLAFNNRKQILPYCIDGNPFDDDLEYYLSSKQRIISQGDLKKDFEAIRAMVQDYLGVADKSEPVAIEPHKKKSWKLLALLFSIVLAIFAARSIIRSLSARPEKAVTEEMGPVPKEDSIAMPENPPVQTSARAIGKKPSSIVEGSVAGTFSGSLKNGFPDGFGTLTFKSKRRIDMHDLEERIAEPGDYVKGDWTDGHLNYGEWYSSDGMKKGFIRLGDHQDTNLDHQLGKCGKS